ncbi:hypothetical protein ACNFU2_06630 [Chryseobacterium sp. PTM-20240506]|uniref:hypothetical protein n=1 Tax=Chryseobacterium sp. PTM-20240506 TaxID=3400631 RepID=UPI003AAC0B0D
MENQENREQEGCEVKLNVKDFFKEFKDVLGKAPKGLSMIFFVREESDIEGADVQVVLGMQGAPGDLSYGLFRAFEKDDLFKKVITTAVEVDKIRSATQKNNSLSALSSLANILRK